MKKHLLPLLVLGLILVSGANLKAQNFGFGINIAPAIEWYGVEDQEDLMTFDTKNKMSFAFGPSAKVYFADNFNVGVSLLFQNKKFDLITETGIAPATVKATSELKTQYLLIPVDFNGQFPLFGDFSGVLNFGLIAAIKTKARMKDPIKNEFKKIENITPLDIYLSAGAGLDYQITDELHATALIKYNHGLIDNWLDKDGAKLSLKNRNLALSLGLYINF